MYNNINNKDIEEKLNPSLVKSSIHYYDIPALSASGINLFFKSPMHFWKESPFNPERIISETTPSQLFGKICHKLALERDDFENEFLVLPELNRTTNKDKAIYNEFLEKAEGRTLIAPKLYQEALILADALWQNAAVKKLLRNGRPEQPIYWNENGLPCKAKPDYLVDGLIIDYKTSLSASPEEFVKSIVNFGYHRQADWYLQGCSHFGERPKGFVFIVQDKNLPEAIGIYTLNESSLELAREENTYAVNRIQDRLQSNNWSAFPERIQELNLPIWYRSKFNQGEI